MSEARVTQATVDDLEDVLDLWVALVDDQRDHGAHILAEANRDAARQFLGQSIAAGNAFLAIVDGVTVGFATVHVETGVYEQDTIRGIVDNVYVVPAYRDRGVGTDLLDAAEAHLTENGAETIALSVLASNDRARRLYRDRGYAPNRVVMERGESDTHSKED